MNKIERKGEIVFPKYLHQLSRIVGELRDQNNKKKREDNKYFDRGGKNLLLSIVGVKAELIFFTHLWANGIVFKECEILSDNYAADYDVYIADNCKIDVKGLRKDDREFMVNERIHKRKTMITHYAFVQEVEEQKARYWIFPYEVVSQWELRMMTYTNAYCKEIPVENQLDLFEEKKSENGQ